MFSQSRITCEVCAFLSVPSLSWFPLRLYQRWRNRGGPHLHRKQWRVCKWRRSLGPPDSDENDFAAAATQEKLALTTLNKTGLLFVLSVFFFFPPALGIEGDDGGRVGDRVGGSRKVGPPPRCCLGWQSIDPPDRPAQGHERKRTHRTLTTVCRKTTFKLFLLFVFFYFFYPFLLLSLLFSLQPATPAVRLLFP